MLDAIPPSTRTAQLTRLPLHDAVTTLAPVLHYWQRLRDSRPVPARAEINPQAIQPYLGQSGMIERTESGAVKFRFAGRRLEALVGMTMRGLPLRTLFKLAHRDRLEALVGEMFDGPRLLTVTLEAEFEGQPLVAAHMALLPLSDPSGGITRALIVLTPQADRIGAPCRFRIRHAHVAQIGDGAPARPTQPRRPDLRVIEGGRR